MGEGLLTPAMGEGLLTPAMGEGLLTEPFSPLARSGQRLGRRSNDLLGNCFGGAESLYHCLPELEGAS